MPCYIQIRSRGALFGAKFGTTLASDFALFAADPQIDLLWVAANTSPSGGDAGDSSTRRPRIARAAAAAAAAAAASAACISGMPPTAVAAVSAAAALAPRAVALLPHIPHGQRLQILAQALDRGAQTRRCRSLRHQGGRARRRCRPTGPQLRAGLPAPAPATPSLLSWAAPALLRRATLPRPAPPNRAEPQFVPVEV